MRGPLSWTASGDAPAKINLLLNVLGKRADGFHEIETVFQRIGLRDTVELVPDPALRDDELSVEGEFSEGVPTDRSNLVMRAVDAFRRNSATQLPPLRIVLTKRVPAGSGLGGGSSDAAATLLALAAHSKALVDPVAMAATIGSDCAFFAARLYSAIGRGRGEVLERIERPATAPTPTVVIVRPDFGISTAEAYGALTTRDFEERGDLDSVLGWLAGRAAQVPVLHNSFARPMELKYPALRTIRERLIEAGALAAMLSGSGSAVFGLFDSPRAAEDASRGWPLDYVVRLTMFLDPWSDLTARPMFRAIRIE